MNSCYSRRVRSWRVLAFVVIFGAGCSIVTNLDGLHDRLDASAPSDGGADVLVDSAALDGSSVVDPIDVAVGVTHACAITRDGRVFCWGSNKNGECGQPPSTAQYRVPVQVAGVNDAKAITAGDGHTCIIRSSGVLSCWGDNQNGQLGVPLLETGPQSSTPVDVKGLGGGVTSASGGSGFTCVVRKDLQPFCFGVPTTKPCAAGLMPDAGVADPSAPRAIPGGPMLAVASGIEHTCFASSPSKNTYCMGTNSFGQMGQPPDATTCFPLLPANASGIPLVVGRYHTCTLRSGSVSCLGSNLEGEIANVTPTGTSTSDAAAITNWKTPPVSAVATKWQTTCAIASDKTVECVGSNVGGDLGRDSDAAFDSVPDKVQGVSGAIALSAGIVTYCAVVEGSPHNKIYCWGSNIKGTIGSGSDAAVGLPQQVALPE